MIPTNCLQLFNPSLIKPSIITAINLSRCPAAPTPGFNAKLIGKTTSGVLLFNTFTSTGGSGNFQTILMVKPIRSSWQGTQIHHYTALKLIGRLIGGDRDTGSYYHLRLSGNTLTGQQYSRKNPANQVQYPSKTVRFHISA